MAEQQEFYRRVIVQGILTTGSDLHIGTGDAERYHSDEADDSELESYLSNTVVLDKDNKPYIPGSTLRGLLASQLQRDVGLGNKWFGDARQKSETETTGGMGTMRVYDASCQSDGGSGQMSRTQLDAVTATAKQHHLSTHTMVRTGSTFQVEIELDAWSDETLIHSDEIEQLLALLATLDQAQIGKGKSVGQGTLEWKQKDVTVSCLSEKSFAGWLQNNFRQGKQGKKAKYQSLSKQFKPYGVDTDTTANLEAAIPEGWVSEGFDLVGDGGAILINNPHDPDVRAKKTESDPNKRKHLPNHAFLAQGNKAIIPGSTLKGWFRAHCRRILLTLCQNPREQTDLKLEDVEAKVDQMLEQLFGSTEQGSSLVRFYDATLLFSATDKHEQTFNAVDRFTGGVKDSALYKVRSLCTEKAFKGRMAYDKSKLTGWMNLLLLFVWRDAEDGDLVVGWGKSKGFGQLKLKPHDCGWQGWLEKVPETTLQSWEQELWGELGLTIQEQSE